MKEYFKSENHFIRFNKTTGELLNIFINLDALNFHIQVIPLTQVNEMVTILGTNHGNSNETEFNGELTLIKDKISNL
jgi:hypothetical protein